jgi:hypothetical protein
LLTGNRVAGTVKKNEKGGDDAFLSLASCVAIAVDQQRYDNALAEQPGVPSDWRIPDEEFRSFLSSRFVVDRSPPASRNY